MKKAFLPILALLLCLTVLTALTGCGNPGSGIENPSGTGTGNKCLTDIRYTGTIAQWDKIAKESGWDWNQDSPCEFAVHCPDGDLSK